jgi:hypothetical protein
VDPLSGQSVGLFNPRTQVWSEHFQWSRAQVGLLEAKTACGRATIARLQMNHPVLVDIRRLLADLGLFPESLRNNPGRALENKDLRHETGDSFSGSEGSG